MVDDTRLELVTSRTSSGCATSCANRPCFNRGYCNSKHSHCQGFFLFFRIFHGTRRQKKRTAFHLGRCPKLHIRQFLLPFRLKPTPLGFEPVIRGRLPALDKTLIILAALYDPSASHKRVKLPPSRLAPRLLPRRWRLCSVYILLQVITARLVLACDFCQDDQKTAWRPFSGFSVSGPLLIGQAGSRGGTRPLRRSTRRISSRRRPWCRGRLSPLWCRLHWWL